MLPNKHELSPKEYERFNARAKAIATELEAAEIPGDLLTVDLSLYEVGRQALSEKQVPMAEPSVGPDFEHEQVKEMV